jgi:threonyl-tRNA synthetase
MSLEFVIIPSSKEHEKYADEVVNKIKNVYQKHIEINIDTNYNLSLNSRMVFYRKDDKDIIVVNHNYLETRCLLIRFSEKGSRITSMYIDDFIELIASFEDTIEYINEDTIELKFDDTNSENSKEQIKQSEDNKDIEDDRTCTVM